MLAILAYSLPVVVGLVLTRNPNVLWGYAALLLHFFLFWYITDVYYKEEAGRRSLVTAVVSAVLGLVIVVILIVYKNPNIVGLVAGQFVLSWISLAMIQD